MFDIDLEAGIKICTVCGHEINISNILDIEDPNEEFEQYPCVYWEV